VGIMGVAGVAGGPLATARAAGYHLYSCRTPNGAPAPADGWHGSVAAGSMPDVGVGDGCESGGALVAYIGEEHEHAPAVDRATWAFQAPSHERVVAASLRRAATLRGAGGENSVYELSIEGPGASESLEQCAFSPACETLGLTGDPFAPADLLQSAPGRSGTGLSVSVRCGPDPVQGDCRHGFAGSGAYAAIVRIYAADITLEQDVGPSASNVSGELQSASTLAGTPAVAFDASDAGSGLYEAVFTVDGRVVQRSVLDEEGGRCRDVGQSTDGLPAFVYVQPCPSSVSAAVPFDSRLVANGEHHLLVSVTDAAGNSALVLDRVVAIENQPPPGPANGVNASSHATLAVRWSATGKERLASAYGHGHEARGLLTSASGVPISGASVEVAAMPASAGAGAVAMASAHTDAEGRFMVGVPAGASSRTLRFVYRSHLGDASPAASATLLLSVRAGLSLSISPRTASVGHSIRFRGRLLGGPVPLGGKQLVLEARAPGARWIEFDNVRTDSRGRYHASYRFRFPGPAVYQFRVLCEPESDYPYAQGSSPPVDVRER